MSYSQNDEEAVILSLLGAAAVPQRFLDIGAHDGVTFSNTRRLADLGWGGTLVEPSPAAFVALMRNYERFGDVELVHAAIVADGPQRMIRFYDAHGDMVSTFDEAHRTLWDGQRGHKVAGPSVPSNVRFQPIQVAALSVVDLLTQYPGPYAVLNLDVEGANLELFSKLNLRALGVVVACVEYQDKRKEIELLAAGQGYRVTHSNTENLILAVA